MSTVDEEEIGCAEKFSQDALDGLHVDGSQWLAKKQVDVFAEVPVVRRDAANALARRGVEY